MWNSAAQIELLYRAAEREEEETTEQQTALAELALGNVLNSAASSVSIPSAAKFLRQHDVIVLGDTPSSLSLFWAGHRIMLKVEEEQDEYGWTSLVNSEALLAIAHNCEETVVSLGFAAGLIFDLKLSEHFTPELTFDTASEEYFDDNNERVDITDREHQDYPHFGVLLNAEEVWNDWNITVSVVVDMTVDAKNIYHQKYNDEWESDWLLDEWMNEHAKGVWHSIEVRIGRLSGSVS